MRKSQSSSRIRKRTFVVSGLVLLAIFLVGGLVTFYASTLSGPDDLVSFAVDEGQSRSSVLGSGISLSWNEPANLLRDSSFEPLVFRQTLTIYSGDATTLTVSSEDASSGQYGDGFFDNASARVMARTANGLSLKKTARVRQYGINRVGVFQQVKLPGDTPAGLAVLSFVRSGEMALAVGEKGLIIRNVTSQMPEIAESGLTADLTGICAVAGGYLVCSNQGDLLFSQNGQDWQDWHGSGQMPLQAVAASEEGIFVAVGDNGTLIAGQDGPGSVLKTQTQANLTDIAYGSSTYVAIGEDGVILISRTGLLWQSIQLPRTVNWRAIDFRDGRFVLVGDGGSIAYSDDGRTFKLLEHENVLDYIDIVMLSRQQLILLDEKGGFAVSNDSGLSWLKSGIETGMQSQVISLAGKDKILSADGEGKLGLAQLVAEIQLDSPLKDGQYQAGDLIFLEKTAAAVPDSYLAANPEQADYQDPWEFFGSGSRQRVVDDAAPGGGEASMLLQAAGGMAVAAGGAEPAIISQVIDPALLTRDKPNEVYRIELWMKQSEIVDRSVQLWLTGPFSSVGTTLTNVGATWKKYSYTFIMPSRTGSLESHEIRLNIAAGTGRLWLDRISITRSADSADLHSSLFQAEIQAIHPQMIRLAFLAIGSPTVRQENWAAAQGNDAPYLSAQGWTSQSAGSLHAAMNLVNDCAADPWLVIDSYTGEAELLNLLEYLAGPISEPYGKIRLDQGSVMPWSEQFGRILIEFTDTGNILQTDQLKADFVNLMIRTISQSPYYRQIKGKLAFVDGMTYRDGVILSTADYHASDLNGLVQVDRGSALQETFLAYYDQIPRNPEKPIQSWPELIRSARLRPNGTNLPTLADLTEILLRDLGRQSSVSNLELPDRNSLEWQATWPAAASIASLCARGIPLSIKSDETINVRAQGFETSQQVTLAITNFSDKPAICQLVTSLNLRQARLLKYDSRGVLISRQTLRAGSSKLTVLPGGVVLIIKDLTD